MSLTSYFKFLWTVEDDRAILEQTLFVIVNGISSCNSIKHLGLTDLPHNFWTLLFIMASQKTVKLPRSFTENNVKMLSAMRKPSTTFKLLGGLCEHFLRGVAIQYGRSLDYF